MATFRPEEEDSVYVGHGTELTGAIRARDTIVIDGSVEGEIVCGHLIVGQGGSVKGVINVSTADIAGEVSAEILAKNALVVRATGRVEGKWECGTIEVARGAILNGSASVMDTAGSQRRVETRVVEEPVEMERSFMAEEQEEESLPTIVPVPLKRNGLRKLGQLQLRTPRRSVG